MLGQESMIIFNHLLILLPKVIKNLLIFILEKKEVLDTILEPVSMMGLNMFKDEQTKKL